MTTDTGKMKFGAQQTTVDGSLHVDYMRIPKRGVTFYFQADVGMNPETTATSRRSPGVCRTANEPATARDRIDQAKQAV